MQRARKRVRGVPSENTRKGTLHEGSIAIAWIDLAGLSCASSVLLHLQTDAQLPVVQGRLVHSCSSFCADNAPRQGMGNALVFFFTEPPKAVWCIFRSVFSLSRMPLEFSCNHVHLHTKPGGGSGKTGR